MARTVYSTRSQAPGICDHRQNTSQRSNPRAWWICGRPYSSHRDVCRAVDHGDRVRNHLPSFPTDARRDERSWYPYEVLFRAPECSRIRVGAQEGTMALSYEEPSVESIGRKDGFQVRRYLQMACSIAGGFRKGWSSRVKER